MQPDETEQEEIVLVCFDCGITHGARVQDGKISSYRQGLCASCYREGSVTNAQDFGGLKERKR